MSFDRRQASPSDREAATEPLAEACYVPQRYEPNYPYPMLVMFHSRGGDEQQMVRSASAMNWRNYVGLSLRGPESVDPSRRADRLRLGPASSPAATATVRPRAATRRPTRSGSAGGLADESPDPVDVLEDVVFAAVRKTRRTLHVHSERIFLVGYGRGGRGRLPAGADLPGAVRRGRGDQRLAPRPLPPARPAQGVPRTEGPRRPRRVERPRPGRDGPTRRRHPPGRRPEGRLPVLPVRPPADFADALRRRHLADQPVHGRDLSGAGGARRGREGGKAESKRQKAGHRSKGGPAKLPASLSCAVSVDRFCPSPLAFCFRPSSPSIRASSTRPGPIDPRHGVETGRPGPRGRAPTEANFRRRAAPGIHLRSHSCGPVRPARLARLTPAPSEANPLRRAKPIPGADRSQSAAPSEANRPPPGRRDTAPCGDEAGMPSPLQRLTGLSRSTPLSS